MEMMRHSFSIGCSMKVSFVFVHAMLIGLIGSPGQSAASHRFPHAPAVIGYGVCAKGPCLRKTNWKDNAHPPYAADGRATCARRPMRRGDESLARPARS
jgi:hypothetical protein